MEAGATLQVPTVCPNGRAKPCKSTSFRHMTEVQRHSEYQELRVQEKSQSLAMGSLPRSITVIVLDDLADKCQPGGASQLIPSGAHAPRPLILPGMALSR